MFKIYDGRAELWQWDTNVKLIVNDDTITEVHFCNGMDTCALVCEVYTENGTRLVNVPNIVLQSDFRLKVWGYAEDHTKYETYFKVNGRCKPSDYIYTETEVKSYEKYEERLAAIEEDYITSTDIAGRNKHGIVSCGWGFGVGVNSNGVLYSEMASNALIDEKTNEYNPIVPANLEYAVKNVGDGYYVKKTDIATPYEAGVVKVNATGGISINPDNNTIYISYAGNSEIDGRTSIRPIVPANLEYAVNSVVGNQIGDIDRALINIMNIQGSYMSQGYSVMTLEEGEINE